MAACVQPGYWGEEGNLAGKFQYHVAALQRTVSRLYRLVTQL